MPNVIAALICASGLWVIGTAAGLYDVPKRPAGEAWVVTASEKMSNRPILVRAHMPYRTAALR
jgi:hypothetical protein